MRLLQKHRLPVIGAALALLAAIGVVANPRVGPLESGGEGAPELVAATFASAWCASCKVLKPRLAGAMQAFERAPVRFVEYDFTFGALEETAAAAAADGLESVYERFSGATGFTLLVDAETGEIVDMLTIEHSEAAMRDAIRAALVVAEAR